MTELAIVIYFITEVIKYITASKLCFNYIIKKSWSLVVGSALCVMIVNILPTPSSEEYIAVYFLAVVTSYCMIVHKGVKDFENILLLLLGLSVMDEIIEKIIYSVKWFMPQFIIKYSRNVSSIVVLGVILIFTFVLKSKNNGKKTQLEKAILPYYIEKYGWVIIFIMIPNILISEAGLNVLKQYEKNNRKIIYIDIISILSYVTVLMLFVFIFYIRKINDKLKKMVQIERQLKEEQEKYYQSLLQREEDTRKSRHDWNNHLVCLSELACKEQALETQAYIENLKKDMRDIQGNKYEVGNDIINAILNYHLGNIGDEIDVSVEGMCTGQLQMEDTDLCVIVANLIQNAVEYLFHENYIKEKYMRVKIQGGKYYHRIFVINSLADNVTKNTIKKTSKKDSKNHGYGLQNVRETVEKNNGSFEVYIKDNQFIAEITLKNLLLS
jgi:two-component sensor histidine kinase